MVNFKFKKVLVVYKGKGYVCSGRGEAEVKVEGYYHFYPGKMWYSNGDPGYPDEVDAEVESVELERLGEVEVEEIEAGNKSSEYEIPTKEELEEVLENTEFDDYLVKSLNKSNIEYDEYDLYEILEEQSREEEARAKEWRRPDDYYDYIM